MAWTTEPDSYQLISYLGNKPIFDWTQEWLPPPPVRGNARQSWRGLSVARRGVRQFAAATAAQADVLPSVPYDGPMAAQVDIWPMSRRRVDLDNLLFGLKPFWDGLEDAGVIVNDADIVEIVIRRQRVSVGVYGRTQIRLFPADVVGGDGGEDCT